MRLGRACCVLVGAWAGVASAGCGALLDLDGYSTATSGGAAGAGGGDGGTGGAGGGLADCGVDGVCAATPPAGWHGPVALTDTGCGGSYPLAATEGVELLAAPPADCSCACGPPAGELCGGPLLDWSSDGACQAPSGNPWSIGCVGSISPPPTDINAMRAHPADPSPGVCQPVFAALNPAITSRQLKLCGYDDGAEGCASGQSCAPVPPAGFEQMVCVYAEGVADCPGGFGYADKHVVYTAGLTDTRSCTLCECAASTGASCTGETKVHYNTGCNSLKAVVPHDDSCVTFSQGIGSVETTVAVVPGSCAASGGLPDGDVIGEMPITVCCTPPL